MCRAAVDERKKGEVHTTAQPPAEAEDGAGRGTGRDHRSGESERIAPPAGVPIVCTACASCAVICGHLR